MSDAASESHFWSQEASALAATLESGPGGLTSEAAQARLASVGPNSVDEARRLGALRLLVRQFESPLVLILAFAAVVSLALQQWVDAAIILTIVIGSSLLGFLQEYRASTAVEELRRRLALMCRVLRDGGELTVPVSTIVPGDVVVLSAGNMIPADGLVIAAADFLVSEASMTGESFPVEKRPGIVPADAPIGERTNSVFLGASVRSGTARVLVVHTGRQTEFGAIAARLRARPLETDFAAGVRRFGYLLLRVMVVIVLFVLTVNLLLGRPVIASLLFAVALAVGLSPELLPAIISVTLSAGARAMSRRGVIVRRLDAIENLGSMDILCTDKTGTLTEGTIVLHDIVDANGQPSDEVRRLAYLNAAFESGIENPLDAAIVAAGEQAGLTTRGHAKFDEIPYDFLRRRLTIVVAADERPGRHLIVTKGAFANVLDICTSVDVGGVQAPLDDDRRAELAALFEQHGTAGYRVLAVATREVATRVDYTRDDEQDMTFRGLLVFHDPPKADAKRTIQDIHALGIRVKVISGDNRYVTAHLAESIGLDGESMLTGETLATLKDEALWHLAPRTDLFVEIDPQQKERIVRALQRTGHSVGYLGDGINDAPALHAADVGISVEQAVDVARESADIILLSRDLDVLRSGVEDGRRTFANTLKYIAITTSANFGNMVSMALATPLLPFLPLAAKQILLNNFLSDVPSLAISSDAVDAERVARPQRWNVKDIQRFMIVFGLVSSAFDLLTFGVLLRVFRATEATFQTAWFVISLLTELAVVLLLRTQKPAFRSRPSPLLLWSTVAVIAATLAIPFLGRSSAAFGFVPLSAPQVAAVVAIVLGYVVATELVKAWFYQSGDHRHGHGHGRDRAPGLIVVVLAVALATSGCAAHYARIDPSETIAPTPPASLTRNVVLVSIDGLRPDAIATFEAPTLQRLIREGSATLAARTIDPSKTLPSHTSMLTGVPPERHGVMWNTVATRHRDAIDMPTIFSVARAHGYRTAAFFSKAKFQPLQLPGTLDYTQAPGGLFGRWSSQRAVADVDAYLTHARPNLLFVHLTDPDAAGHRAGWMSKTYGRGVAAADAALARLIGLAERTYGTGQFSLIVTADHGGHGHNHGSADPRDVTIPWIAWGEGVKPGALPASTIRTMDTAATVLWLLGVPTPADWAGTAVVQAYQ